MISRLRKIALVLSFAASASTLLCQVATGIYPLGTYDSLGPDTINVGNLNDRISIPVLNKTGRGMNFSYSLVYNSSIWSPVSVNGSAVWIPATLFGWQSNTLESVGVVSYSTSFGKIWESGPYGGYYCSYPIYDDFTYVDPFGVSHLFQNISTRNSQCAGVSSVSSGSELALDGSGYTLNVTNYYDATATSRNATQYAVAPSSGVPVVTDSNGNQISISGNQFIDTTGDVVLTVGGGAPNPQTFTYNDTHGNPQAVTMNYTTYTVQTAFGCNSVGEYGPTQNSLVSSITLPDGSTYNFSYEQTPGAPANVTGRLSGIQLPQGDWIYYTYSGGNNGIECADGSTAGLTRTLNSDSGSASSTWTFDRSFPNGTGTSHTEVVDGLNNHLAYDFVQTGHALYETNRNVYEGAESGTPDLARQTCYDAAAYPCVTSSASLPISQVDTYESLNGSGLHGSTVMYNTSYGVQTESEVYDFGTSSARGSVLRTENWTYGYSIPNLATQDEVFDGNGNEAGNNVYQYDGRSPISTSGVPQHISVSGPRGNLTSASQYASASTSYNTTAVYEDTGSVFSVSPPTGTTSLSYDPTFVYATGVSFPTPTSGVSIGTSAGYDTSYTGLPLTSTDPNGEQTSIVSYDTMLRPTQQNNPDGGKIIWAYTPTTMTTESYQSSSAYAESVTQLDGYGRLSRVAVYNGQSANQDWYQTDTCYDANGNVNFVSYPYQSTGFVAAKICSGPGTSYFYDVQGRLSSVVQSDGETRTYTYLGRATESIDENGVTRISQIDGLGRQTIVCEISSNSSMPGSGSPTSCGTDIGGTGFTTTYSYSLATGTTTITQGAQTRTFQVDWLGRPVSVTEPESGITTYTYSYNSTGLQVTRTRPQANQTNPSITTTTTTQYDSLGRPIIIGYSDGTPTKNLLYDQAQIWGNSGVSTGYAKGRLTEATSSVNSQAFVYDSMGRVTANLQCLPTYCGNGAYDKWLFYSYDWLGNELTATDGAGVTTTYTYSPANEVLSITSSANDPVHPPDLVSNVQNGPFGPQTWQLGNGLTGVRQYDVMGRVTGGWVCQGTSQTFCIDGGQIYGFTAAWSGDRVTTVWDTVLNDGANYGYDEFNRLTSRNIIAGAAQNFTYVYDRYGNRWQQNVTGGSGPAPQFSFNTANNQIAVNAPCTTPVSSEYCYDAAGNMTSDGFHTYVYDANGNVTQVDGGSAAEFAYNALNQRVQINSAGSDTMEFVFNLSGQRASVWDGTTGNQTQGQAYWGATPVEYYAGYAHFQHQDWLGTERVTTNYAGNTEGTYTSLPFGDGFVASGADDDPYHFATLDHDYSSNTDHAQFRQFNNTEGRWMSPDPYDGSYDPANPQSFNRYAYAGNSPLGNIDPVGLSNEPYIPPNEAALQAWLGGGSDQQLECGGFVICGFGPGEGGGGMFGSLSPTQSAELAWLASGSIPYYSVSEQGELMLALGVQYTSNPDYSGGDSPIGEFTNGWEDLGPALSTYTSLTSLSITLGGSLSSAAGAPNNYVSNYPSYKGLFCAGDALAANGVSLALDAAGFFLPAKGAIGAATMTVSGVASAFNSLYHQDIVGAGAGAAGEAVGLTYGGALAIGASWAGVLPGVSTVLNVGTSVRDVISTGTSYNNCVKSSKYD